MTRVERPPIPVYYWILWAFLLAAGLFVFYVVLTPVWIGIRLVAWLAEHGPLSRERE